MICRAILGLCMLVLPGLALAQAPPAVVIKQKQMLRELGYFKGRIDSAQTKSFQAARRQYAKDINIDFQVDQQLAISLQETYAANRKAWAGRCPRTSKKVAVACLVRD